MKPPEDRSVLASYFADIRGFPVLSRAEEQELLRDVESGGAEAMERLVTSNLGFVVRVAREYRSLGLPLEDLLNEGNIGLIEAARRFDPQRGTRFLTYAVWWIRKSILRAVAEHSNLVRVPGGQIRQLRQIRDAEDRLSTSLGYRPSRQEISRYLSTTVARVERVLTRRLRETSLDEQVGDGAESLAQQLADADWISPERRLVQRDVTRQLSSAYGRLTRVQKLVIALRFGLTGEPPQTLNEVGNRIGISRERVRQIEKQAKEGLLRRMRKRR